MAVIHIGSESEYSKITLPSSYSTKGWAQADAKTAVHGFHGQVKPWVDGADFEIFTAQLRLVYESLQGEAEFSPIEKQFTLKLVCKVGGHIKVSGTAWSQATCENKLEYVLELDQSYLLGPLRKLEDLLALNKRRDA